MTEQARIPAIETQYKGYRFRSRLEARWAVFFDALGIAWEYEKEGYDLGAAGYYLPDFWLPGLQCWLEVKGKEPTQLELGRAAALAEATRHDVFLFAGAIAVPGENDVCGPDGESGYLVTPDGGGDNHYRWTDCPHCGRVGLEFEARADRLPCHLSGCPRQSQWADKGYNGNSPRLIAAYEAAAGARFEHGERPGVGAMVTGRME